MQLRCAQKCRLIKPIQIIQISFPMSLFSKVELKELKQGNEKVIRIAVSNVAVNPTIAITTSNKIHLFNESGEKHQYELSRSITPTCIEWHPINPILAIGWDNGRVTIWNEQTKAPKEQTKPHSDPIMLIRFNPSGSRMVTSDLTGMVAIWRGINLLAYYKKDWAITHCLFCDINLEGNKSNFGNLFLFAGRSGTVCLANDLNMCSDVCRVGGTIKALIFYQKEGSAIVITSTLLLVQFKINFSEKSSPEKKVKLSISGEPENLSSIWIGSCLLATCSNQNLIRFWHLEQDENYTLTIFDVLNNEEGGSFGSDKISSIVYDGRGRSLVAGTRDGRLLFWKNMALGSESPVDKEQWSPQPFLPLGKSIQLLTVGKNNGVIVCKQSDGEVIIVTETRITGKMSDNYKVLLTSAENIDFHYEKGQDKRQIRYPVGSNVKGIDIKDDVALFWTNKKVQIIKLKLSGDTLAADKIGSVPLKAVNCAVTGADTVLVTTDYGFNQLMLTGQVKQTVNFPESEGKVLGFHIQGSWLVVWTQNSYLKIFSITAKQCKQVSVNRKFEDSKGPLGVIKSCQINSDGTKVGIISTLTNGAVSTIFYVYDTEVDTFMNYDLGSSKIPVALYWDNKDKRFFGVQTEFIKSAIQQTKQEKREQEKEEDEEGMQKQPEGQESKYMGRDFLTFFCTTQTGIRYQDKYNLSNNMLGIMALRIPFMYLLDRRKDSYNVRRIVLHDFLKLNYEDQVVKNSILNFSFHLTSGNLDEAYKSVKSIQNPVIWEKMAAMCVKTKRLDVAEICIGNMRFARGARSIRESKKEPELEAQLAMVAIQLDMPEEAKALYEEGKRYDLLDKMYQANGNPEEAIEVAEKFDRINLKNTYYSAAKSYEAASNFQKAIEFYEKSGTHCKQVPRMLLEAQKLSDLETYVNRKQEKELSLWLGQYKESIGEIEQAVKYYEQAGSSSNLVRLHLSQGQVEPSIKICNAQSEPQACFLLARYLQKQNQISEAIHFYAKAQYYSQAIKIAIDRQLDGEIMSLSMMSPKEVVFRSAVYFEKKGFVEKAVILYRKAGANKKAIDLATKHNLPIPKQDEDDKVNENDPSSMNNKINSLIESGRYDRAVPILVSAKQYDKAFELCLQYSVPIPDDLVKKMFPDTMPPDEVQKKADLIRNVADRLRKQGSFDIASQLYVKLGDKSKAMKCLIELGDQEKVITFAVNARTPEIYILAGNFLQTADWHKNSELVKHIINFYNKAKAHDNLAGFFEACSSLEIDEYRNYEKALAALKESLKHAQKSTAEDKQARISTIQSKIELAERFVRAQELVQTNPQGMISECLALLEIPDIQPAVRSGDIFAVLIQYYYETKNYNACYEMLKKMQQKKIIATPYIDTSIIQDVYAALGIKTAKHQKKQQQPEDEIIDEQIKY